MKENTLATDNLSQPPAMLAVISDIHGNLWALDFVAPRLKPRHLEWPRALPATLMSAPGSERTKVVLKPGMTGKNA